MNFSASRSLAVAGCLLFTTTVARANPLPDQPAGAETPTVSGCKFAGLSPADAAKEMILPPGFKATLFAGEPDVKQPIAFAMDHRGRIWVAEAYTYPIRAKEGEGKDRILVFEDTNGDGKFDKRTVFMEGLNLVSGLEVGFGGVYVGAVPYLMYIPIKDGDEPKPAGPPEILLDGWAYQDTHETLNTFQWGPDGWLYGCHGVFTHSNVGKPGAAKGDRLSITAAVWRYHPTRRVFERFAEGTSNPWGIDFDEHGQCITEGCVIPHLWHMIQGGRFERQGGQHVNPYIFDDIKTIADHLHYLGNQWNDVDRRNSDSLGGGHAHAGLMVYQGASWPSKYRGQVFMNNIHGSRINMDTLERSGSGFIGHHGADFINFNDSWSQIINLEADQDGSVYLIDWYDKNQCHSTDPDIHDRSNGRIFKVVYGNTKTTPVNIEKLSNAELVKLTLSKNEWLVRHARRALQERGPNPEVQAGLLKILNGNSDPLCRLRALWALHVTGGLDEKTLLKLLSNKDEYERAWAIQLLAEDNHVSPAAMKEFVRLAKKDPSPVVRLYLSAMLQRVPAAERWDAIAALDAHGEDAADHNLPFMYWYAAEPLAPENITRALQLAATAKIPRLLEFTVRRTAAIGTPEAFADITKSLGQAATDKQRNDVLEGLALALKGQRDTAMPEGWAAVEAKLNTNPDGALRTKAQSVSLEFGSTSARAALHDTVMSASANAAWRNSALQSLIEVRDPALPPLLQQLVRDPKMASAALRGLAIFDDAKTPEAILSVYASLNPALRRDALNTLVTRAAFARPLLAAVGAGTVPVKDLTADLVRVLRRLKGADLEQEITKVWGVSHESSADKKAEIAKFKAIFINKGAYSNPSDASRGRAVFTRTCQQCHTLYGVGGKVGPDLTGSNRRDLDYLLENVIDPNAVIPNDYRASNLETKDGRTLTGIVTRQDAKSLTLVTANEEMVIPRGEIESQQLSALSMMPEGLLQSLSIQEVRDLIFYLMQATQAPLPAGFDPGTKPGR